MRTQEALERFWKSFLDTLPAGERPARGWADAWSFGNSPEMADELLALVLQGEKTATSGLKWSYEAEDDALPEAGQYHILLDGGGMPRAVIEIVEVRVQPFRAVEEEIAFEEGEGDRSLSFWRQGHWRFFAQECRLIERTPSWDMEIVSERFRLAFPQS